MILRIPLGERSVVSYTVVYMHYHMNDTKAIDTAAMSAFVEASKLLDITNTSTQEEKYAWIEKHLNSTRYLFLPRKERRAIKKYIEARTGLSRSQVTRLITQKKETGKIVRAPRTQPRFTTKYTPADIALLAKVDAANLTLSGPATRSILFREFHIFGKKEYERLANISSGHLYNLRNGIRYAHTGHSFTKTKGSPHGTLIGIRKKPENGGKPGYLRVDSVHQGDLDKEKGVYHINLVDEVTQWEIIMCVEGISEFFLLPALEEAMELFPFKILNFHSDNGSEYINGRVAEILEKLRAEQTKSRSRRSTDNALVETKNNIIRKNMGHSHIPKKHATLINAFYRAHMDEYLNYHRPCGFATDVVDSRGKVKKKYDTYLMPYEKLMSLPDWEEYLKEDVTAEMIRVQARKCSDTECAELKEKARLELFKEITRLVNLHTY